jgi:hypothetical protein
VSLALTIRRTHSPAALGATSAELSVGTRMRNRARMTEASGDRADFSRNNGEVIVPHWIVDALPERLWVPGNLFIPRYGDAMLGHWHFCVGPGNDGHTSVRTIERNGHELALGRRPFNFKAQGTDI